MLICISVDLKLFANDCTTPSIVNLCPEALYTGESTAGQVNDRNSWQFSAVATVFPAIGNDKVYEVNMPVGSINLWIDVTSTASLIVVTTTACGQPYYETYSSIAAGCNRTNINLSGRTKIYVWIDRNSAVDANYDISFSVISSIQNFNKGTIFSDYFCTSPMFKADFGLTYNGIQMIYPLTYPLLGVSGTSCYQIFLRNSTGIEALKRIVFVFDPDLVNPQPVATSTPGFYATGNWIASKPSSSVIQYDFVAVNGRGDFDGLPTSCHMYPFCFTFTPVSNNPFSTKVDFNWTGDAYGNVTVYNGCFSTICTSASLTCVSSNCTAATTAAASTGSGASVDPPLASDILNFNVKREKEFNILSWITVQKQQSENFDIERSVNGQTFYSIGNVSAGKINGSQIDYRFEDKDIVENNVYYRLKQVEENGSIIYSEVKSLLNSTLEEKIILFPNPAKDLVTMQSTTPITEINIFSVHGELLKKEQYENDKLSISLSLANMGKGVYFVKIMTSNSSDNKKILIE